MKIFGSLTIQFDSDPLCWIKFRINSQLKMMLDSIKKQSEALYVGCNCSAPCAKPNLLSECDCLNSIRNDVGGVSEYTSLS